MCSIINDFLARNEICLTDDEAEAFTQRLTIRHLGARGFYIKSGELQNNIGYVVSGLLRVFYIGENGNETTVNFINEGDYISHYAALLENKPSRFNFQCLEPTTVIDIPYSHIIKYSRKFHCVEHYMRMVVERIFLRQQQRIEGFLMKNAEQRYLDFIKNNPSLFNRVSVTDLSSYIGIERQSLTRIRKRLLMNK